MSAISLATLGVQCGGNRAVAMATLGLFCQDLGGASSSSSAAKRLRDRHARRFILIKDELPEIIEDGKPREIYKVALAPDPIDPMPVINAGHRQNIVDLSEAIEARRDLLRYSDDQYHARRLQMIRERQLFDMRLRAEEIRFEAERQRKRLKAAMKMAAMLLMMDE